MLKFISRLGTEGAFSWQTVAKPGDPATDKNSYMEEVRPQTQQLEQTRRPSISQTQILVWKRVVEQRWALRGISAGNEAARMGGNGKIVIHLTEFNAFATDINHCDAQDRTAANRNRTKRNQTIANPSPKCRGVEWSGVLNVLGVLAVSRLDWYSWFLQSLPTG